jgi:hypothetical protein
MMMMPILKNSQAAISTFSRLEREPENRRERTRHREIGTEIEPNQDRMRHSACFLLQFVESGTQKMMVMDLHEMSNVEQLVWAGPSNLTSTQDGIRRRQQRSGSDVRA